MIIRTYKELEFYVQMFKNRNADLLILESSGGLGKTQLVEELMKETEYTKIVAHVTPLRLYTYCYENRDKPIVLDDVDSLLQDDNNIALLKMLCETSDTKEICWFSTTDILDKQGIPERYETKSRVIIICNNFKELSDKISAIKDRGWHLEFKPTDEEILNKMAEIKNKVYPEMPMVEKDEVYTLIKKYAKFCDITLRTFIKGLALFKECNNGRHLDWQSRLLESLDINQKLILLDNLLNQFDNDAARIGEWEKQGLSRRSFYNYKQKLVQKCS